MPFPTTSVLDYGSVLAVIVPLMSLLKPLIEALPFARPGAPAHDNTIRVVTVLLAFAAICGMAYTSHTFDPQQLALYVGEALSIAVVGHASYRVVTRSGSSVATAGVNAPAPVQTLSSRLASVATALDAASTAGIVSGAATLTASTAPATPDATTTDAAAPLLTNEAASSAL